MTKLQIITLIAIMAFALYECYLYFSGGFASANIRVDLVIFPLIIALLVIACSIEYFIRRR